jgi:hypothetical protein
MTFKDAAILGSYLSKDYAEEFFRLLVNYRSISASEAASRLNLHIKTAQDFLESMATLSILEKEEVYEKKRPYNRYTLKVDQIKMELDLTSLATINSQENENLQRIREKKNAGVRFTTARGKEYFSSVAVWFGKGRERAKRKINLTVPQGKFLFHLPFPTANFETIEEIAKRSGVDDDAMPEIFDIVNALVELKVIERQ